MNELEKILNELSSIIDDQEYMEKEYPEILGWAIKGAMKWAKDGLVIRK